MIRAAISHDAGAKWTEATVSDDYAYWGRGADHQSAIWDLLGLAMDRRGLLDIAWSAQGGGQAEIEFAHQLP
jgi:hypothetical protein